MKWMGGCMGKVIDGWMDEWWDGYERTVSLNVTADFIQQFQIT